MRLYYRGRDNILCNGQIMKAAIRPVSGKLSARRYGEYMQDMLRLLLPWQAKMAPGDRAEIRGAPYICVSVRAFPGHRQAEMRRCSR